MSMLALLFLILGALLAAEFFGETHFLLKK
jgi:hypothetical protein